MGIKQLAKQVLQVKEWQDIERFQRARALYSFVKNRTNLFMAEYPQTVILEFTTRCNSKCFYCPRQSLVASKKLKVADITFSTLFKILYELQKANPFFRGSIRVAGMGEPTLWRYWRSGLHCVKAVFPRAHLGVITNGITLGNVGRDMIGLLDGLIVSLNSNARDTYFELNGVDKFEDVKQNLEEFLTVKGDQKPAVQIQLLKTRHNQNEYPRFKHYWTPLLNSNDSLFYERFVNFVGTVNTTDFTATSPRTHGFWPCLELFKTLSFTVAGDVYPCCAGSVLDTLENRGGLHLGNVWCEQVRNMLTGQALERIRMLHKTNQQHSLPGCSRCDMWKGKANPFVKIGGRWR